jgi:predicted nucleic acid-binding protein
MQRSARSTANAVARLSPTSRTFPCADIHTISFLPRVWDLRNNLTAYDAVYVALVEALDAPPLTRDKRLAAASGHHARVELV